MTAMLRFALVLFLLAGLVACGNPASPSVPDDSGDGDATPQPGSLSAQVSSRQVLLGGTVQAFATARSEGGDLIEASGAHWSSSAAGIASVDPESGVVTGRGVGSTEIRASRGGEADTVTLEVLDPDVFPSSSALPGMRWEVTVPTTRFPVAAFTVLADGSWLALDDGYARDRSVFASTDGGDHWTERSATFPDCRSVRLSGNPFDPGDVLASCNRSSYLSEDGGASWSRVLSENLDYHLPFQWGNGSFVQQGRYVSGDGGRSWSAIGPFDTVVRTPPVFYATDGQTLHASADAGMTWSEATVSAPAAPDRGDPACTNDVSARGLALADDGELFLYGTHYCVSLAYGSRYANLIYESVDAGATWTLVSSNEDVEAWVNGSALFVHPLDPDRMILEGGSSDPSRLSVDGGRTWSELTPRLYDVQHHPFDADLLIASDPSQSYDVVVSRDRGATWSRVGGWRRPRSATPLIAYPERPATLHYDGRVSTDGGITWTEREVGTAHLTPTRAFFATSDGVQSSSHATPNVLAPEGLAIGLGRTPVADLRIDASDPSRVLVATAQDGAVTRAPTASSWSPGIAATTFSQAPGPDGRWVFANGSRLAVSDDGSTETYVDSLPLGLRANTLAVSPDDPDVVYAATNHGVYVSRDGMRSWTWASDGIGSAVVSDLVIDPTNAERLFAATNLGVNVSSDAGASWSPTGPILNIPTAFEVSVRDLEIAPDGATLYAGSGTSGVLKSTDGGLTWFRIVAGLQSYSIQDVELDPSDPNIVYVATHAGVWKSLDQGASWAHASLGLPIPRTTDIEIAPDGSYAVVTVGDPYSTRGQQVYVGTPDADTGAGFSMHAATP